MELIVLPVVIERQSQIGYEQIHGPLSHNLQCYVWLLVLLLSLNVNVFLALLMIKECVLIFNEHLYERRQVIHLDESKGFWVEFFPAFLVFFKGFLRDSHVFSVVAVTEALEDNGNEEIKEDEGDDYHER